MIEMASPLASARWEPLPATDPAALLEQVATLRLENAALRAQHVALPARIRELEARLAQTSPNSSGPPSSDPPRLRPEGGAFGTQARRPTGPLGGLPRPAA